MVVILSPIVLMVVGIPGLIYSLNCFVVNHPTFLPPILFAGYLLGIKEGFFPKNYTVLLQNCFHKAIKK